MYLYVLKLASGATVADCEPPSDEIEQFCEFTTGQHLFLRKTKYIHEMD